MLKNLVTLPLKLLVPCTGTSKLDNFRIPLLTVLRSRAMFPRLRLQIFFRLQLQVKNFGSGSTYKSSAPAQKIDFDTKHLKNVNFNK